MSVAAKIRPQPQIAARALLALAYKFCPGWKAYFLSLHEQQKQALRLKYQFRKY